MTIEELKTKLEELGCTEIQLTDNPGFNAWRVRRPDGHIFRFEFYGAAGPRPQDFLDNITTIYK